MDRFRELVEPPAGRRDGRASSKAGRIALAAALALALGVGVAACGSSSWTARRDRSTWSPTRPPRPSTTRPSSRPSRRPRRATGRRSRARSAPPATSSGRSIAGQPADYVHLSTGPDMQALVDAGIVDSNWDQNQYHGIVQDSVVVFVVRKGNPKDIQTWDDLVKPGVEVVTPNVFSSGGAKWNLLAAYGAQIEEGKSPDGGAGVPEDAARARRRPAGERKRRPDHVHERQGRRPALLRERRDRGPEGRRGRRLRHPRRHDPDRDAGRDHDRRLDAGAGLPQVPVDAGGAAAVGGRRLPAGGPVGARQEQGQVPDPARPVHGRRSELGGWEKANTEFFDPENGSVAKIESDLGVSTG